MNVSEVNQLVIYYEAFLSFELMVDQSGSLRLQHVATRLCVS